MLVETCPVLDRTDINDSLFVLTVAWKGNIIPGQFFMVQIPDSAYILPRPFSAFEVDTKQNTVSFLIRIRGKGSKILSQLKQKDRLKLFGSLGHGFQTNMTNKTILCVSGSEGIAPFWHVLSLLHKENNIILLAGFSNTDDLKILRYFSCYQNTVDIRYTVNPEPVTNLLTSISEPDFLYICGSMPMMRTVCGLTKAWQSSYKQLSLESRMACGTGACMGCTCVKDKLLLKVCTEGPVFEVSEVFDNA